MMAPRFQVAVTGHRPDKLRGHEQAVREFLREQLIALGVLPGEALSPPKVLTGMAQGVDQWMAETCIELGVPFIAAIPFVAQADYWPLQNRIHYRKLLDRAERCHVVTPGVQTYTPSLFHRRNQWMVDRADYLIAVWNGDHRGGTAACVHYARRIQARRPELDGICLNPDTGKISRLFADDEPTVEGLRF